MAVASAIAIGLGAAVSQVRVAAAVTVPIVVSILALAALLRALADPTDASRPSWLGRVTAATFVAHVAIGLVVTSHGGLVETFGGDAVTYDAGARAIVDHWNGVGRFDPWFLQAGKEGFFYGLAGVYWIFGAFQVAGLIVNGLLAAAVVPVLYDTARRLFGTHAARTTAALYAVLPGFLIWTSQLLREATVLLLLALAANATVRLSERASVAAAGVFCGSVAVLLTVRSNVGLLAAAGLLGGLALGRRDVVVAAVTGGLVVALLAALVLGVGIGARGYEATVGSDLETVSLGRQDLATTAESGIAPEADISTPGRAVGFLPLGVVAFGFGPFPWTVANLRQAVGLIDAMTVWALFPSLIRGWVRAGSAIGRRRYVLAVPAAVLVAALSLYIGNYGTVVRERLQVSVLVLPIVGYGWVVRSRARAGSDSAAGARDTLATQGAR